MRFTPGAILAALLVAAAARPLPAAVYFGDVHAHSGLSDDGTGAADVFFTVARDVVGLDFVVLSDHDVFLTPDEAEVLKATAASFDAPGSFVAFSAVEWTSGWHMNAYFRGDAEPYCLGPACRRAADFYAFYGPRVTAGEAAAHVNHPADPFYRVEWDEIDDRITTNVEIWNSLSGGEQESGIGNALWALQAGFRLGLVGVSDDHHTDQPPVLLGTGLTGCRVDTLARADLLAALRERRCYGTDGERIELDFDLGGTPMGGDIELPLGSTVVATASVMGTDTPAAIEIVRNGSVVGTRTDCGGVGCTFSVAVEVTDLRNFVYARVRQANGRRAWSSPVWVAGTCPSPAAPDCARRLLPGGGRKRLDCLAEWTIPAPRGAASRALSCTDGDPACDAGTAGGECTFRLGLCFGRQDRRLRRCTPAPVEAFELLEPDAEPRGEIDVQNRMTLLAAARALGSTGTGCTPLFDLRVPIGLSPRGRRSTGTRRVRSVAHAAAGDDADGLALRCRPTRR